MILMKFQAYNKALIVPVVAIVLAGLGYLGVTPTTSVQDALTALITTGLVFLVPNKQ